MTGGSRNRAPAFIGSTKFALGAPTLELLGSVARHSTDVQPDAGINDTGTRGAKPAKKAARGGTKKSRGKKAAKKGGRRR